LVAEHVHPFALDLLTVRRFSDRVGGGEVDARVGAFLREHGRHGGCPTDKIGMTVHVNHVV